MNQRQSKTYNTAVGLCDALTGVLLMLNPKFVLSLLQINNLDSTDIYLRYVGVFVFGTGLTYFLPLFAKDYLSFNKYVWIQTALIRLLVACFVILQVCLTNLVPAWLIVATTDASIGLLQVYFLFRDKNK